MENKKKFRVRIKLTLTATYDFDAKDAAEAEHCARYGLNKGYIEWDEGYKPEFVVEEIIDETNPLAD